MKEQLKQYINQISSLSEDAFAELIPLFSIKTLRKHDFFIKEGQYARQVGFLRKGIVRAFFVNQEGKEYNKQFFVGPALVGAYTSLLTKLPNKIAQQALTDCEVLVANYEQIEALYKKYHDLERFGRKVAEFYFLEKEEKEIEMGLLDADKRYLILRERFPLLESQISQYHIASYLGITPTQLSRIRKKMSTG